MVKDREILLIVLCGLPASGKSQLSRFIREQYRCSHSIIVVEYDLLLPFNHNNGVFPSIAQQVINTPATSNCMTSAFKPLDTVTWKAYRGAILGAVDAFISETVKPDIEKEFELIYGTLCKENASALEELKTKAERPTMFVIDDNMYLKSMRYDYYRLARKRNIGFCQIHLRCSLDSAIKRNSLRQTGQFVEESVIRTMYERLEPPDAKCRAWESLSLELDTDSSDSLVSGLIPRTSLDEFLQRAFHHRVPPAVNHENEQISSRLACRRSVLHQVDIALRKLVSEASRKYGADIGHLNASRREILSDLRNGVITLDSDHLFPTQISDHDGDREDYDTFSAELFSTLRIMLDSKIK